MLEYIEIVFSGYSQLQAEANSVARSYLSLIRKAKFIKNARIGTLIIDSENSHFQVNGPTHPKVNLEISYNVLKKK